MVIRVSLSSLLKEMVNMLQEIENFFMLPFLRYEPVVVGTFAYAYSLPFY